MENREEVEVVSEWKRHTGYVGTGRGSWPVLP